MSMPKGHKSKHGYATISSVEGGMDYRTIAETMTKDGHKMNHATCLLYTSPSPRDRQKSRMPSSA